MIFASVVQSPIGRPVATFTAPTDAVIYELHVREFFAVYEMLELRLHDLAGVGIFQDQIFSQ